MILSAPGAKRREYSDFMKSTTYPEWNVKVYVENKGKEYLVNVNHNHDDEFYDNEFTIFIKEEGEYQEIANFRTSRKDLVKATLTEEDVPRLEYIEDVPKKYFYDLMEIDNYLLFYHFLFGSIIQWYFGWYYYKSSNVGATPILCDRLIMEDVHLKNLPYFNELLFISDYALVFFYRFIPKIDKYLYGEPISVNSNLNNVEPKELVPNNKRKTHYTTAPRKAGDFSDGYWRYQM